MRLLLRSRLVLTLLWAGSVLPVCAAPPTSTPAPGVQAPPLLRSSMRAVITSGAAYLPGAVHMVAPARVNRVVLHPQGRYALIVQSEAAPPPGAAIGKAETGAAALFLYDARLNKTKLLWECRADSGRTIDGYSVAWLAGSDCAVVVVLDVAPRLDNHPEPTYNHSLLFFNFEKGMNARTLVTTPNEISLEMSPTKPIYLLTETDFSRQNGNVTKQIRMGTIRGTLGTPVPAPQAAYWSDWNLDGTTVYGSGLITEPPATPDAKPRRTRHWYEWNGQSATPTLLSARPALAQIAKEPLSPALPFALQTAALPVPPRIKDEPPSALHPLYLEATDTPADAPNHSVRVAPDAAESYLLPDKSAVLYQSDGALYAVPLTKLSLVVFADAQKAALRQTAISNAKQAGLAILGYIQDYDEKFPPVAGFADLIGPYIKNADILKSFTYVYPGLNQASLQDVAATVLGYVNAPGGRAVLYADGHVRWEDPK